MAEREDFSAEIIKAAIEGDPDAWTQLIEGTRENTLKLVGHFPETPEDAEDAAQETALVMWRNRQNLNPDEGFVRLAGKAAKQKGLDQARAAKRRRRIISNNGEQFPSWVPSDKPSVEEQVIFADDLYTAFEAIGQLPPLRRSVIYHRRVLGYSVSETGAILDIPIGTVQSSEHRGKLHVQESRQ